MIEATVGRDKFDAYLKGYFDRHAFQPVTPSIVLADIRANLVKNDQFREQKLRLEEWIYKPGIPANAEPADPTAFAQQDKSVAAFAAGGAPDRAAWNRWTPRRARRRLWAKCEPQQRTPLRVARPAQADEMTTGTREFNLP
jgi:leukotriene-A4 hydrolase